MPIALKFRRSFRSETPFRRHRKNLQVRSSRKRKIASNKQKSNEFGADILRILLVNSATNAKVKHYTSHGNTRKKLTIFTYFQAKTGFFIMITKNPRAIRKIFVQKNDEKSSLKKQPFKLA